ncbi:MAG TPA: ATP-binding protein [Vicinamibacterales bacterium]|nr:ATP-binding protein [Vicinamibacterales bacterium]
MRYLAYGILYVAAYLGAGALLADYASTRAVVANTLLMVLPATFCLVVLRRRDEWEGTQRMFWETFAAGLAMWCIGQIGFTNNTLTGQRSWVQWHTMFSLCGGIGPVVAMLARPYLGPRKQAAWATGIDLISYAMLIGFVFAYFIMVPSVVPASGGPAPQRTLLTLVQLQRFVLAAGLLLCVWLARRTEWRDTFVRLAIGASIGFVLRYITSGAISANLYREGSLYDLAWIVPFFCYVWAAREAPRSASDSHWVPVRNWRGAIVSALPAFFIPLVGFGLLHVQPIGQAGDSVRLLLTTLATVAGLGLLTLRLSMQSGELQRSDARVRMMAAATEQTADLILITTANGEVEHANDACVSALGYTRDELAGMTLPDLLERGFERTVDHVGSEVRQRGIWRGTMIYRRKDGGTFPAASTVVALRGTNGRVTHFVGVLRDITEELHLRDQLVHSERLSAVGELVAGVAHEINNPLQTIIGCVELMIEERRQDGPQRDLELVRQEATRAGQIVRNLLSFVRRSTPDRVSTDLNQIARATAQLREHHLRQSNIALHVELHQAPLMVSVNREEIQQIVVNLVLNAEHAIGDRPGTIVLRTEAGDRAHRLSVVDTGPGISPELRGRVFEPFFTTKNVGEGTGLGLSIALGIARSHGGSLDLCPTQGGACFQLTLPASPVTEAAPVRPQAAVPVRDAVSGRHALVVEDEAPIRALLKRMLANREYAVTEARSYAEVRAASPSRPFDLVLCDVRLPDASGADCLRHLRAAQPGIERRFVFMTGDFTALDGAGDDVTGLPVLSKPFTGADLDRVLGRVEVTA